VQSHPTKPLLLSHPNLVLGDQGTDHQVTGSILPERKVGVSPTGGLREIAERLPHTQAVKANREIGIGVTREVARGSSAYHVVNRVAPGSSMEGRERKRVTAPGHGAVWSSSSRLG